MIYIVDDDTDLRKSLSEALTRSGYQTLEFFSAANFLEKIHELQSPGVILLDMHMPGMSGIELQWRLTQKGLHTPIIFISGKSHPQQIIDGLQNGAYQFVLKPFDINSLKVLISEALEKDGQVNSLNLRYNTLTPREKEVVIALAKGRLVKQIALDRRVSESVIKLHKSRAMEKLAVKNLQGLTSLFNNLPQQYKQR